MNGWDAIANAAAKPTAALRAALAEPRKAQLQLMQRLLDENARTRFGVAHDFAGCSSLHDFQRAVPIRTYEELEPWIEAVAKGEERVLTASPAIAFERTGGSASGGKLIPYTEGLLAAFRAAVLPWLEDLLTRRPAIARGGAYVAVSPAVRHGELTVGGLPIGLPSEGAYLGADLAQAFAAVLVNGREAGAAHTISAWQTATLVDLVRAEDLTLVSVWSPTFFTRLLDALTENPDVVLRQLGEEPRTAGRLRAALCGSRLDTRLLWPRLDIISCWTDAASQPHAEALAARVPDVQIEPKGLLATESATTLPFGFSGGNVPALTSALIEFIDPTGAAGLADELEVGGDYRVVITTPGGLYRYDIGDRLRCVGHDGPVPLLRFTGRAGLVSDMVGEKLTEDFVVAALAGFPPAMLVAQPAPSPHYELWVDDETNIDVGELDARLRANPQYAYARDLGQLGAIYKVEKPGFLRALHDERIQEGARLGDLKAQALLPVAY